MQIIRIPISFLILLKTWNEYLKKDDEMKFDDISFFQNISHDLTSYEVEEYNMWDIKNSVITALTVQMNVLSSNWCRFKFEWYIN